jgi:hypothetical protein
MLFFRVKIASFLLLLSFMQRCIDFVLNAHRCCACRSFCCCVLFCVIIQYLYSRCGLYVLKIFSMVMPLPPCLRLSLSPTLSPSLPLSLSPSLPLSLSPSLPLSLSPSLPLSLPPHPRPLSHSLYLSLPLTQSHPPLPITSHDN